MVYTISTMYVHMIYVKSWIMSMVTYIITFFEIEILIIVFYGERLINEAPLTATIDISYYIIIFIWLIACSIFSVRSFEYSERRGHFDVMQQVKEIKEWKKLMADLPDPVIFAEKGTIHFFNKATCDLLNISMGDSQSSDILEECEHICKKGTKETLKSVITNNILLVNSQEFIYQKNHLSPKRYLQIKCVQTDSAARITEYIFNDVTAVKALARTKAKEQCFDVLLATASHDIRTPLNIMLGVLDGLCEQIMNKEGKEQMKVACNCGQRMIHYLQGLSLIRHINLGTLTIKKKLFNPLQITEKVVQMLDFSAQIKNLTIKVSTLNEIPDIICSDAEMYTLIIQNLLENSVKYTFIGQITISLSYSSETHILETTLSDTGIGMSAEQVQNAGVLFKKLGSTRCNLNPQGLGLGLFLAKTLSLKLEGTLTVKSEPGRGTKVKFGIINYPFIEAIPEVRKPYLEKYSSFKIPISGMPTCNCTKVLLVDDEPLNLIVLGNYLDSVKIPYDKAENGQIAIDKIINQAEESCMLCTGGFKTIFMDINMPVLDGVQATIQIKKMRQEGKISNCSVIAVTAAAGLDNPEIYARYIDQGFSELCIFMLLLRY